MKSESLRFIAYVVVVFSLLLLPGCSQTVVKYQCADGSFMDSISSCPSVTCKTDCPKLDCSSCPAKVETKVENKTVVQQVFICPDGKTEVSKKEDCSIKVLSSEDYALGDEVVSGNFKWKFTKYSTLSRIGDTVMDTFFGEVADGEFLIIDVEVENIGTSAKYLMDSYVKLVDDQEREFVADTMAAVYLKPAGSALSFDTLNPGVVKKGKIVFDVPSGLKIAKIRVFSNLASDSFYNIKLMT